MLISDSLLLIFINWSNVDIASFLPNEMFFIVGYLVNIFFFASVATGVTKKKIGIKFEPKFFSQIV